MKSKNITVSTKELKAIVKKAVKAEMKPKTVYFSISEMVQREGQRVNRLLEKELAAEKAASH